MFKIKAMITHLVFFSFSPSVKQQQIQEAMNSLLPLKSILNGLEHISWHTNIARQGKNKRYSHVLVTKFLDLSSRDEYLANQEHLRVARELIFPLLDGSKNQTITLDFES